MTNIHLSKPLLFVMDECQLLMNQHEGYDSPEIAELHRWVCGDALPDGARSSDQIEHVKQLLAEGADVHVRDEYGRTPLHCCREIEIAQILLDAGASLEAIDHEGNSPLHGVFSTYPEIAEFLIFNGADTEALNNDGETPLKHLRENSDESDFRGIPEAFERGIARRVARLRAEKAAVHDFGDRPARTRARA